MDVLIIVSIILLGLVIVSITGWRQLKDPEE